MQERVELWLEVSEQCYQVTVPHGEINSAYTLGSFLMTIPAACGFIGPGVDACNPAREKITCSIRVRVDHGGGMDV